MIVRSKGSRRFAPAIVAALWLALAGFFACLPTARAVNVVGQPAGTIDLAPGQGRLLRFDEPVGSVLVGDPAIADVRVVSQNVLYVYGSAAGHTNLIVVSGTDKVVGALALVVARDNTDASRALAKIDPKSAIELSFAHDRLVVKGVAKSVEEAMNAADTAADFAPRGGKPLNHSRYSSSQQINIRVRFAEVSRNQLENIGVNWQALANVGATKLNLVTGTFVNPVSSTQIFGNASANVVTKRVNAEVLLDALHQEGMLTTLAEPNLTTVSGETAEFLAGGEIPIPVQQPQQVTTIEFKPFGVSIKFTPTLLPDNRIGMRVAPSVSAISATNAVTINGFNVPSFTLRRAEATVEVASGETFALAGLLQRDTNNTINKFPVLGDLPVLGPLFRSNSFQRDETELVILITPYLVQPTPEPTMAEPTDFRPAGTKGLGVLTKSPGPAGFIVN